MSFRTIGELSCDGTLDVADLQLAGRGIMGVVGGGASGGHVHTSLKLTVRPGRWVLMAFELEFLMACHADALDDNTQAASLLPIGVLLMIRGPLMFRSGAQEVAVALGPDPSSEMPVDAVRDEGNPGGTAARGTEPGSRPLDERAIEPHARVLVDRHVDTAVIGIFLGDA